MPGISGFSKIVPDVSQYCSLVVVFMECKMTMENGWEQQPGKEDKIETRK
jgi:hypothetical protein